MKISKPVSVIPAASRGGGRKTNEKYDKIEQQVLELETGLSIPVTCETKAEVSSLILCMKRRGLVATQRGLTVYVSRGAKVSKSRKRK